jgi:hypothetical protein
MESFVDDEDSEDEGVVVKKEKKRWEEKKKEKEKELDDVAPVPAETTYEGVNEDMTPVSAPVQKSPYSTSGTYGDITIPDRWDFSDIRGAGKNERIVRRVLEMLYGLPFPSVRPPWLINPKTGRRLEIDCFNAQVGLCVEVSGLQHFEQSAHFHRSREEFLSQVYRDRVKKEIILSRGLDFIVVPYTVRSDEIPFYIQQMLRKLGRLK